jgi:arabinan endo-1,5-alpha-L-arabinosidase
MQLDLQACLKLRASFWSAAVFCRCSFALPVMVLLATVGGASAQTNATGDSSPPRRRFERDEQRVHDPSTITRCNDKYWVFSTGPGITSRYSTNLINWNSGPNIFTNPPAWTTDTVPGNRGYFWAPDVVHLTNGYFVYYSVSTWGKRNSAIGLTTTPTLDPADPKYRWTDRGIVFRTTETNDYNAIDPSVMLDKDGRLWMAFGSYWSGIKLIELDAETGLRKEPNSPIYSLAHSAAIEAACLAKHDDQYYLFVNWGQCCRGTNSTYEIRVGGSAAVTGPYLDRGGKDMLQGGGSIFLASAGRRIGPGHAAILIDGGKPFVSFHYYNAEESGRPRLEIAPLRWTSDGWPEAGTPLMEPSRK